jgi:putative transposase
MSKLNPFRYLRTSPEIICLAVMMYVRFPLSLRNVEDLLHERGIKVSHETVRFWWRRFGPMFATEIRWKRVSGMRLPRWCWHLDEVFVKINGVQHYLWRAVDYKGEVLESYVTKTRDKAAALKFLKKLTKRHGRPEALVIDGLRSYGAALKELGAEDRQVTGLWENNRIENSHQPLRRLERAMLRFRRLRSLQMFAAVHSSVCSLFNTKRSLTSRNVYKQARTAALAEWRGLCAASDLGGGHGCSFHRLSRSPVPVRQPSVRRLAAASFPLRLSRSRSKERAWPSRRSRSPARSTAEMWTNTSSPPPSCSMKPKPLVALNHLTVPRPLPAD